MARKRKQNARVKSAVSWRLIDFVETVRDSVPIKSYGSVPCRTSKGSCHPKTVWTNGRQIAVIQNKNLRSPVEHTAPEA